MENYQKIIYEIVAKQFDLHPSEVLPHTSFEHDLGADSVDLIMLMIEVENVFGFSIPPEQLAEITTPQKALEMIKKRL